MKIGKYEFKDEATADSKIKALGVDEDGNETKAPVLSDKYHLDVAWKLDDTYNEDGELVKAEHPYGWKSSAVAISDGNGVHSFYGLDYQELKI